MASNSSSSKAKMEEKEEGGVTETLAAVGAAVGVAAVAWWGLSKLFGGSEEKTMKAPGKEYHMPSNSSSSEDGVTETLAVVGGTAVALWGLSKLVEGSEEKMKGSKEKMMKAPGKEYYMPRKDFESNPAGYFRNNRK